MLNPPREYLVIIIWWVLVILSNSNAYLSQEKEYERKESVRESKKRNRQLWGHLRRCRFVVKTTAY